jgi:hypothetical protein
MITCYLVCKSANFLLVRKFSGLAEVGPWTSANANPLTIYIPLNRSFFFSPLISGLVISGTC